MNFPQSNLYQKVAISKWQEAEFTGYFKATQIKNISTHHMKLVTSRLFCDWSFHHSLVMLSFILIASLSTKYQQYFARMFETQDDKYFSTINKTTLLSLRVHLSLTGGLAVLCPFWRPCQGKFRQATRPKK